MKDLLQIVTSDFKTNPKLIDWLYGDNTHPDGLARGALESS